MHGDVANAVKAEFSSGYMRHESFAQIDVTNSEGSAAGEETLTGVL